ncbi:hypothetical protein KFK09_000533 [Dendrobium nobile]|uniref:Uncharacterized protein n=1 Tax=Dendrobium nobile TaxID=94219 RepID=A0A8T3C8U5_DENNO|nr:hypothetical protein KFK09_000533 [Dendrobium nobile]
MRNLIFFVCIRSYKKFYQHLGFELQWLQGNLFCGFGFVSDLLQEDRAVELYFYLPFLGAVVSQP